MQKQPSSPSKSLRKSPHRSPSPPKQISAEDAEEDIFADLDFSQPFQMKGNIPTLVTTGLVKNNVLEAEKPEDPQELILLYEAKTHQMENKIISLSKVLEISVNEKKTWETGRSEQVAKIAMLEKQIDELQVELQHAKSHNNMDPTVSLQWAREKEELEQALEAKTMEIHSLSTDLDQKSENLLLCKQELVQEREKSSSLEAIDSSNRALLSSQEIEVTQLTKMTEWLNQELSLKSSQLLDYRKEKSAELNKLQSDLERTSQEKSGLESRAQSLQKRCDDLETSLESKMGQLRESENRQISTEQQFLNEMTSQKKLTDLYKGKSQEFESHNKQLEDLVREMECRLDRLVEEQKLKDNDTQEKLQKAQDIREAQDLELEQLRSQLELINSGMLANSTAEQIAYLSETASIASKISNSGKSFTQVYADYTKLQQEMIKEKSEVARLTECLNSIVREFELRAPMIQKTNEDYEKAKLQVEKLSINLSNAIREKNLAIQNQSILQKSVETLTIEQNLLQKEIEDRSRQVQACLREQEILKGAHPSSLPEEQYDDSQLSGADSIISNRLIVFKNIEELQSQNQALIRSIRLISAKMEAQDRITATQADEERLKALTESKNLIDQLQDQLRRESLNAESFSKERDQWRRIAESRAAARNTTPFQSPESSPPRPVNNAETISDYENFYRELQREFDAYRKESGTDTKMLKAQLESTQSEKTELSIQVAKLNNQVNYLNDRHELLISSSQSKEKDFEQLRERLTNINETATRQDIKIEELSNALLNSRQSMEKLSYENQQFKVEKQIWKASESRILKEYQDITHERNTANDRIRELQNHIEEKDHKAGTKIKRLEDQLDEMTRELALSRKQVSELMNDHRTLTSKRDAELRESQIKIQKLTVDFERTKGDLALVKNKEENAANRVQELLAKITALEQKSVAFDGRIRRSLDPASTDTEVTSDLESELRQLQIELEATKAELEISKDQAETYRAISQASEERLAEMISTADSFKCEIESKNEELLVKLRSVEADKGDLELRLKKFGETLTETQDKMDAQSEEYSSAKEIYEKQISSLKQNEEQALKAVAGMKIDLSRHIKIANDSRASYEREVVNHSNALQEISSIKASTAALAAERDAAVSERQFAVDRLSQVQASFDSVQSKLKQDVAEMENRIEDLKTQNALLHSQFEQLTISRFQIQESADLGEGENNSQNSLADLAEVIKFLRREKEIVETKLQISLQEQERFRVQLEHVQKSLDESRTVLEEERLRREDKIGSDRKHQELLEKIEQTNILRESNITLRTQLEVGQQKIDTLDAKLKQYELLIEPLREQVSQLESEVEARKAEGKALMEDNTRWKGRAQQILEKYERIDPVEHENLKKSVAALTADKAEMEERLTSIQATIDLKVAEKVEKITALESEVSSLKKSYNLSMKQKEDELNILRDPNSNKELISLQEKLTASNEEIVALREKVAASSARNKDIAKQANEKIKARIATIKELNESIDALKEEKKSTEERIRIAILETEQKLIAERQTAIAKLTEQWERKVQSLQVSQTAVLTSPQLDTPSKRKSPEVDNTVEIQGGSPIAKRVRVDIDIPNDTHNTLEDEAPEDSVDLVFESSQADLEAEGLQQIPEAAENDELDEIVNEQEEIEEIEEYEDPSHIDKSAESVKSADLSRDDYVNAPETPAAILDSNGDEDFVGTPEATGPVEPMEKSEIATSPNETEHIVTAETEPIPLEPLVAVVPKKEAVVTKVASEVDPLTKPVSIQRPAASATPVTGMPIKNLIASPKKEITLKKAVKTPTPTPDSLPAEDAKAAALKQQKTLLLQKKLEALRAGAAKDETQKPKIIRTPQNSTTPARGSGRGRASISIRGSRGRGNPPK